MVHKKFMNQILRTISPLAVSGMVLGSFIVTPSAYGMKEESLTEQKTARKSLPVLLNEIGNKLPKTGQWGGAYWEVKENLDLKNVKADDLKSLKNSAKPQLKVNPLLKELDDYIMDVERGITNFDENKEGDSNVNNISKQVNPTIIQSEDNLSKINNNILLKEDLTLKPEITLKLPLSHILDKIEENLGTNLVNEFQDKRKELNLDAVDTLILEDLISIAKRKHRFAVNTDTKALLDGIKEHIQGVINSTTRQDLQTLSDQDFLSALIEKIEASDRKHTNAGQNFIKRWKDEVITQQDFDSLWNNFRSLFSSRPGHYEYSWESFSQALYKRSSQHDEEFEKKYPKYKK